MTTKLDSFDRVLLDGIQEDGRMAQSELGERANLSTAAVNRRLKQLHRTGVIERYTACINPKALGYNLTIIVEVDVERERADLLREMQLFSRHVRRSSSATTSLASATSCWSSW